MLMKTQQLEPPFHDMHETKGVSSLKARFGLVHFECLINRFCPRNLGTLAALAERGSQFVFIVRLECAGGNTSTHFAANGG